MLQLARREGVAVKGRTSETGETGELLVLAELYRREVLGGARRLAARAGLTC